MHDQGIAIKALNCYEKLFDPDTLRSQTLYTAFLFNLAGMAYNLAFQTLATDLAKWIAIIN